MSRVSPKLCRVSIAASLVLGRESYSVYKDAQMSGLGTSACCFHSGGDKRSASNTESRYEVGEKCSEYPDTATEGEN